jgi:hypothetical protein
LPKSCVCAGSAPGDRTTAANSRAAAPETLATNVADLADLADLGWENIMAS